MNTKGVEDGMSDEQLCVCEHRRGMHWLRPNNRGGYGVRECGETGCICQQFVSANLAEPAFHAKVNPRIVDRVWIASYTASEYAGVLSRGLFFRSIHDTKEDAERLAHDPQARDFTVTEYVLAPLAPVESPAAVPVEERTNGFMEALRARAIEHERIPEERTAEMEELKELLSDAIHHVPSGYHKRRLNLKLIEITDHIEGKAQ